MIHFILVLSSLTLSTWAQSASSTPDTISGPAQISSDGTTETWILPAIITEGTPADALKYDPVVPATKSQTDSLNGAGTLTRDLQQKLPFQIKTNGRPGQQSSLIGVGKNSEETDVNALGIPLNSPQGGGFDFSQFPQYIWESFSFQAGPSLGAFDPQAAAGNLTLIPWTQQALTQRGSAARLTAFRSTLNVNQFSVGGKYEDQVAILVGQSTGELKGPAGSISGRWGGGKVSGKYHLLASNQTTENIRPLFGSYIFRQKTLRYLPVLQTDFRLSENALFKTSLFYDYTYFRSEDQASPVRTHIAQQGIESALILPEWRLGLSGRRLGYESIDLKDAPTDHILNVQATRSFEVSTLLVEPTFQLTGVSRTGIFPNGSLGIRKQLLTGAHRDSALFSRLSYSKRFPTLIDRYYRYQDPLFVFQRNPDLKPEDVYTLSLGGEHRETYWGTSLHTQAQLRQDAQTNVDSFQGGVSYRQVQNTGTAHIYAVIHDVSLHPTGWFSATHRLSWTKSQLESTQEPVPFLPEWVNTLNLDAHDPSARQFWGAGVTFRGSSDFLISSTNAFGPRVDRGGYSFVDLSARIRPISAVELSAGVENVFDRVIWTDPNQPLPGRVYTVSVVGFL